MIIRKQRQALASQRVTSTLYYWSKVRVLGAVNAGVLTFAAGKVQAFGYALGQSMAQAGLNALGNATEAETNLEQPAQTNGGGVVEVMGIGVQLASDADSEVARILTPHLATRIVRAGGVPTRLGPLTFLPGAGGIFGASSSRVVEPPLAQAHIERGAMTNGYPSGLNFRPLPDPIKWSRAGTADGTLTLELELMRAVTLTLPTTRAAAAGVAAYAQPSTGLPGTYLDLLFFLATRSVAARSENGLGGHADGQATFDFARSGKATGTATG